MNTDYDCIVIGAGPAGIVAVKECTENQLGKVLAIDASAAIGGNFAKAYDSLLLTSSCTVSMFSDFWIGDGFEKSFWTKAQVLDYWQRYIAHYQIGDKFLLNETVTNVSEDARQHWQVQLQSGRQFSAKRLIVATGASRIPALPDWHSALSGISYQHSSSYKSAEALAGKRVLVVGGGESAADIALEVARVASKTWISLRHSPGWITPRRRGEEPADLSTHRGFWGLPRAFGRTAASRIVAFDRSLKHPVFDVIADLNSSLIDSKGPFGNFGTKTTALAEAIAEYDAELVGDIVQVSNGGRQLIDHCGQALEDVDYALFCTGYRNEAGFLPPALQAAGSNPRDLYKQMFHPAYGDRLSFVGTARPCFGSQFPLMEMQARYTALVFAKRLSLPELAPMQQSIHADRERYTAQLGHSAERVHALVDFHHYLDDLAGLMGCLPPLWRYLWRHPRLWLRMVYGPTQSTQFRLTGPNAKPQLAREILAKIPVSRFNHLVKIGLEGRLRHLLKGDIPGLTKPEKIS